MKGSHGRVDPWRAEFTMNWPSSDWTIVGCKLELPCSSNNYPVTHKLVARASDNFRG
jgi:hypothetical protein